MMNSLRPELRRPARGTAIIPALPRRASAHARVVQLRVGFPPGQQEISWEDEA
jgi:hypothetical protein